MGRILTVEPPRCISLTYLGVEGVALTKGEMERMRASQDAVRPGHPHRTLPRIDCNVVLGTSLIQQFNSAIQQFSIFSAWFMWHDRLIGRGVRVHALVL